MEQYHATLSGRSVEVVGPVDTDDDRRALRANEDFHEGTVVLMSYPSVTIAFTGQEPPRMMPIPIGSYLVKGEAGDFAVLPGHNAHHIQRTA